MKKITLISPIKIKGFKTIIIGSKRKTLTDLLNELPEIKTKILVGYSMGGAVALVLAQRQHFDKLILYSPTPFFKERLRTFPKYIIKILGKKNLADIKRYSVKDFNTKMPIEIHVGEKEVKDMVLFAKYLNKKFENSSLIVRKECNHYDLLT